MQIFPPPTSPLLTQDNPVIAIPLQGWCGERLGRPVEREVLQKPGRMDAETGWGGWWETYH